MELPRFRVWIQWGDYDASRPAKVLLNAIPLYPMFVFKTGNQSCSSDGISAWFNGLPEHIQLLRWWLCPHRTYCVIRVESWLWLPPPRKLSKAGMCMKHHRSTVHTHTLTCARPPGNSPREGCQPCLWTSHLELTLSAVSSVSDVLPGMIVLLLCWKWGERTVPFPQNWRDRVDIG